MAGNNYEELERKAKPGAFSTFDMEVLVPEVEKLESGQTYLEVGVDRGKSLSIARMVAQEGVRVVGVDLREDPGVEGAEFYRGNSVEVAKTFKGKVNVLFIDGDHSYKGCKADIQAWLPHLAENGVILFHDCDESSTGVLWAVSEFVDTYRDGEIKGWKLFKRTDKNTSMAGVWL